MKRILLAVGMMLAGPVFAQQAAAGKGPEYEIVSVKPTGDKSGNMMINTTPNGYIATGTTVKFMIMDAYALKNQDLIFGLPKWASDTRYDVETKMDAETIEARKKLTPKERREQDRLMVQALLADRFKLQVHKEDKELPAYALVPAKGGFKLKPVDTADLEKNGGTLPNGKRGGMMFYGRDKIEGKMVSMEQLANSMGMNVHRQVIDRTGVTGNYDFTLKFTPEDASAAAGADTSDPSLFTALQEQMGLKLEPIKAMVSTVVVDHVEQAGANQ